MKEQNSRFISYLAIGAAVLGFCHGIKLANWQVALEGAQVLAGLVEYPASSPQGLYHKKLWTLLNQIPALALYVGFPERLLSIAISGVGGSLFYVGIALTTYALSKNIIVSLVMPLVVLGTAAAGGAGGVTYPVILLNSPHTYGAYGQSIAVIAVGLIGCGRLKIAALVIGMALAVHPSWGIWVNIVFILSGLAYFRHIRSIARDVVPWLLAGYAITGISMLLWIFQSSGIDIQQTDHASDALLISNNLWDSHRRNIQLSDINFQTGWIFHIVVLLTVACGAWLALLRGNSYSPRKHLFTVLFISSLGAIAASWIVSTSTGEIVDLLRSLMPQRWLNLSILCFLPVLIGTFEWQKIPQGGASMLLMFTVYTLFKFGQNVPIASLWFAVCLFILFGLLNGVDLNKKKGTTRLAVFGLVLFVVPVLSASPAFLYMYSSSDTYFINSIFIALGTISASMLSLLLIDNLETARRWIAFGAICLSLIGINLIVGSLLLPNWSSGSLTSEATRAALLIVFAVCMGSLRSVISTTSHRISCTLLRWGRNSRTSYRTFPVFNKDRWISQYIPGLLIVFGCGYYLAKASSEPVSAVEIFKDRTNSEFWKQVGAGDGLLLTGSDLYLIQLRSRRPVLIDGGALNWLPYIPEAAPQVRIILSNIYGIDYYGSETNVRGKLSRQTSKTLWSQRTKLEWQKLKVQYNITEIIVYDDWLLDLPLLKRELGYALYQIP